MAVAAAAATTTVVPHRRPTCSTGAAAAAATVIASAAAARCTPVRRDRNGGPDGGVASPGVGATVQLSGRALGPSPVNDRRPSQTVPETIFHTHAADALRNKLAGTPRHAVLK